MNATAPAGLRTANSRTQSVIPSKISGKNSTRKPKRAPPRRKPPPLPVAPVVVPESPPGPLWELIAILFPHLDGSDPRTMTLLSLVRELEETLTRRQGRIIREVFGVVTAAQGGGMSDGRR